MTLGLYVVIFAFEQVMGLGFMTPQAQMRFWFAVTWVLGPILLVGVVFTVVDLLTLRQAPVEERAGA